MTAGRTDSEDVFHIATHIETSESRTSSLRGSEASIDHLIDENKLQCLDPQCEDVKFKSIKELKRHAKGHNPNFYWYCGCCQNLGRDFKGKARKDKVQDHLRNIHVMSENKKSIGLECPAESCNTLFTAKSCRDKHMEQHPDCNLGESNLLINGKLMTGSHKSNSNRTVNIGNSCECAEKAASRQLKNGHQAVSKKRRAPSLSGPTAKLGKCDGQIIQPSELSSQSVIPITGLGPTITSLNEAAPYGSPWSYLNMPSNFPLPTQLPSWDDMNSLLSVPEFYQPTYDEGQSSYINAGDANHGSGGLNQTSSPAPLTWPWVHHAFLENSRPTAILIIRKTKGS